jgi:hypothetical protein
MAQKVFQNSLKDLAKAGDYEFMNKRTSIAVKKLLAIVSLVLLGFLPAFGQTNALQPSAHPASVSSNRHSKAVHRRKHRRHHRRHVRRVRRWHRHHRGTAANKPTALNSNK